jgi:hypothetical protein
MRYLCLRYLNAKTAKLFYILIALLALVLASGAPLAFGGQGSG